MPVNSTHEHDKILMDRSCDPTPAFAVVVENKGRMHVLTDTLGRAYIFTDCDAAHVVVARRNRDAGPVVRDGVAYWGYRAARVEVNITSLLPIDESCQIKPV